MLQMAYEARVSDHRRKWDLNEYEELAKERARAEQEEEEGDIHSLKAPPVKRELLKQRDYKVDLDSKLGKSQVRFKLRYNFIKSKTLYMYSS